MQLNRISHDISVSPQIAPGDLAALKAAGFASIICNRPDGEGADQPSFEEIEAVAGLVGLNARYIPVVAGMVSDNDAEVFGEALRALPGPVLAYCGTGKRAATLWSLSQASHRPMADILAATKQAGYDMNAVAQRIANGAKTPTDTDTGTGDGPDTDTGDIR